MDRTWKDEVTIRQVIEPTTALIQGIGYTKAPSRIAMLGQTWSDEMSGQLSKKDDRMKRTVILLFSDKHHRMILLHV